MSEAKRICDMIFKDGTSTLRRYHGAISIIKDFCHMRELDAINFVLDYFNEANIIKKI